MDINKFTPRYTAEAKNLLKISDLTVEDIFEILSTAKVLKKKSRVAESSDFLRGKTVGLLFEKTSTRTRLSFEMAIRQLGGQYVYLSTEDARLYKGESIRDTSIVLHRFGLDALVIRGIAQRKMEDFARVGVFPVINASSDYAHPCQVLSDLFTVWEHKGGLSGVKLAYVGDGNNVASSLIMAAAKCDMDIAIACPGGYTPPAAILEKTRQYNDFLITNDPYEAVRGADIVYTDRYTSNNMETPEKREALSKFQVNSSLMRVAKSNALFMHCLPANRDIEVTSEIIDGPQSIIYDQAENRLHIHKAILSLLVQ